MLTGNSYQFDLLTYKCTLIGTTQVRECSNLNVDACTKNTDLMKCIWLLDSLECKRFYTN